MSVRRAVGVLLLLTALPTTTGCASAAGNTPVAAPVATVASAPPIDNFRQVSAGIYRGAHPDDAGLDYLQRLGVKTIVDLEVADLVEAFPWEIDHEIAAARRRHIEVVRFPMSAFEAGLSDRFDKQMDALLATLRDPARRPLYVHCKHGQDRTGLVIGLERVFGEGWAPTAAHDEMIALGFHSFFLGLDGYFERKTSWIASDPAASRARP